MAGQLSPPRAAAWGSRRRIGLGLLGAIVLLAHSCVTSELAEHMAAISPDQPPVARMEVAYVGEMTLSAPPPTAAPAAPPAAVAPIARPPAPKAPKPVKAASAPEPAAPPASAVLAAASAAEAAEPASAPASESAGEAMAIAAADPALAAASGAPAASASSSALAASASASGPAASSAATALAAASAASAPRAFEWPVSTRVSYDLVGNYRGPVQGQAQVEWVRVGSRYQVHLDVSVGPSWAPIASRRTTSDGEIGAAGLAPRRYDEETRVGFGGPRRVSVVFGPDAITLADGSRRDPLPGVQDAASQFVQLTYVFATRPELLQAGGSIDIPLALPRKVDLWTYDVVDHDEPVATPMGALPTIHLAPRAALRKPGTLSAEIWFAPQLRYLPARIRFDYDEQTYFVLTITRPPEIAGP